MRTYTLEKAQTLLDQRLKGITLNVKFSIHSSNFSPRKSSQPELDDSLLHSSLILGLHTSTTALTQCISVACSLSCLLH